MLPDIDQLLVPDADASESKGEQQLELDRIQSAIDGAYATDPAHLIFLHLDMIRLLIHQADIPRALAQVEKASLLPAIQPPEQAELLLFQGVCLARSGSLERAEESFLHAADINRKQNDALGLARALFLLTSYVLIIRGKFNLALTYIEEAQANFTVAGRSYWGGPWLQAYIHLLKGDLRHARQILFEIAQVMEPAKAIAGAYYYLWAKIAIADEDYDQAREYLRLGLRIAMQTGIPELLLWFHLEQARFHRSIAQYPIAREWAEEACTQARRFSLSYFEAAAYFELAQISWTSNDMKQARDRLQQAEAIYRALGASYDLAYALFFRACGTYAHQAANAEQCWNEAATAIIQGGYAFILEREQETAFPLTASWLRNGNSQSRWLAEQLLGQLANVPPRPLRILGLGQFSVWRGRQYILDKLWLRRRAGELFRFLLIQPNRTASKDTILDTLWPDNDPASANALFHQATSALRRILEPDLPEKFPSRYLVYEGEQLSLRLPPGSLVDFELFIENLQSSMNRRQADPIKEALLRYKGVLFPQDQYNDWTTELRTRLAELHLEALVTLARLHLEQERFTDAFECVHLALSQDAWNEDAVLIGMQTHLSLGSAPHALRLYDQLKATLENDLRILPREDLRKLAADIQHHTYP